MDTLTLNRIPIQAGNDRLSLPHPIFYGNGMLNTGFVTSQFQPFTILTPCR